MDAANLEYHRKILGITKEASISDIKKAYRQQAKQWHPDRFYNDEEQHKIAEAKFKEINLAYEILTQCENGKKIVSFDASTTGVRSQKTDPSFYYNQAVALAEEGDYQASLEPFSIAIKLNPNYLEALEYRYHVLLKLGFEHRAAADKRRITEIKLQYNQSYQDTTSQCDSRVKNSSNDPDYYYYLGIYHFKNNQLQKALDAFSKTINLNPEHIDALRERKKVFKSLGLSQKAQEDALKIERIIELKKQHQQQKESVFRSSSSETQGCSQKDSQENIESQISSQITLVRLFSVEHSPLRSLLIDHHKRLLTVGGSNGVHLTHLGSCKSIGVLPLHKQEIYSIDFHPQLKSIVTASEDGAVKIFALDKKQVLATFNTRTLFQKQPKLIAAYFSLTEDSLIIIDEVFSVKKWDFKNKKIIYEKTSKSKMYFYQISPNRKLLFFADTTGVFRIRDSRTGSIILSLKDPGKVISAEFSKTGRLLAIATANQKIQVWDLQKKLMIRELQCRFKTVTSMRFIDDDKYLITASLDSLLRIWSIETGEVVGNVYIHNHFIKSMCATHQEKEICLATRDSKILMYRLNLLNSSSS